MTGVYTQRLQFRRHDVIGRIIHRLSRTLYFARKNVASIDPADEAHLKLARDTAAYYEEQLAHFRHLQAES
jgi:hypothetical protein